VFHLPDGLQNRLFLNRRLNSSAFFVGGDEKIGRAACLLRGSHETKDLSTVSNEYGTGLKSGPLPTAGFITRKEVVSRKSFIHYQVNKIGVEYWENI